MTDSYDCAFLVYAPQRQRRADNSFDGNDNIGAKVIADALTRAGYRVGYVTASTSKHVPLVLISLTSTYDVYALLDVVAQHPDWRPMRRKFRVLAGGFGAQNPTPARDYLDYVAFGRAHDWVADVVRSIRQGDAIEHPSVMTVAEWNHVTIAQSDLYPHSIDGFKEEFTGCPLKCKFCHYTYSRKHTGSDASYAKGSYVQTGLTGGTTPEVTWAQLLTWPQKAGRIRVAIDGFSERLRYLYGKRISNDDIVAGINQMGRYGPNATTILAYNIVNLPGETPDDYAEFVDTVSRANPKHRIILVVQSTPFRPSLATPMQWEPATIKPDWSARRAQPIIDRPNLRVIHSFTLETAWSHFRSVLIERATPDDDQAVRAILQSPKLAKLNHGDALRLFARNWSPARWCRELAIDTEHPAPHLSTYIQDATLKKIARKMRATREGWAC